MPFKPGSPGRPKGALSKRTLEARQIAEAAGFCPITALMNIHKIAMARFVEELDLVDSNRRSPMESEAAKYLKIAADTASDAAGYLFPKLKAIEQVKDNPLEQLNAAQKLEAFKQAIPILEQQAKAEEPGGPDAS